MIGTKITDKKGEILEGYKNLSKSAYQPPKEIRDLFIRVWTDYQINYALQHRTLDEFDGVSLLQRARMDQETFSAYVGMEYIPKHKRWRYRGRKNTSRNKLIGILAYMLAGMIYPFVYAKNEQDEEDKMTARVMALIIKNHLQKARYEIKFLYLVLSALVNPAVFCEIEYVEAMQKVKNKLADGTFEVVDVVDELLSGLNLNTRPIDEILLSDLYSGTGNIQVLPNIISIRRIPYDQARAENAGKFFDENGKDLFDYVSPGQTKIVLTGADGEVFFDIPWNEADANYVQELIIKYRSEDLELKWIGGVGIFDYKDSVNSNRFKHRRMVIVKDKWMSIPIYNIVMSGFEPIDPSGRFAYYKSGAFKEYWDDRTLNIMHQLMVDGTNLDVFKPIFISGINKVDSRVIAPSAVNAMPKDAIVTPFSLGSNLAAAFNAMRKQEDDISLSTQDNISSGASVSGNKTATEVDRVTQNAKIMRGGFAVMIADLVKQAGELTMDCIISHVTIGEVDFTIPESLRMKFKTILSQGKEKGKNVTNKIIFSSDYMGKGMTDKEKENVEWKLYNKAGGEKSDQRIYMVNPYQFARTTYTMYVDPDKIVSKSIGDDRRAKMEAFNIMTDPRVMPFTDRKAVVDDFAIEEYGGDDPDKYKARIDPMSQMGMLQPQPGQPAPGGSVPSNTQLNPVKPNMV